MSNPLVDKLLTSFDELDRSISVTKQNLATKPGVPNDILLRLDQYAEMVAKQRILATDLRLQIENGKWDEVARAVKLINGLSSMIREDAQQILASAAMGTIESPVAKDSRLLC